VPFRHGRLAFAHHIRALCLQHKFDCIAIDIPECLNGAFSDGVDDLPFISAITVREATDDRLYLAPIDPCDAAIESVRQSKQLRIPFFCVGHNELDKTYFLPQLPDEHAIGALGFDAYMALCLKVIHAQQAPKKPLVDISQYTAFRLHQLELDHKNILALVHLSRYTETIAAFANEKTHNLSVPDAPSYTIERFFVNPDHLYFALGELPFVTGKAEASRSDPFCKSIDVVETIKTLFTESRDEFNDADAQVVNLSPTRIQAGLTFLRNLTLLENRFIPSLPDIVCAAKGIGGNSFALRILSIAKYYPFLPVELGVSLMSMGIDEVMLPDANEPQEYINIFRDEQLIWRTLSIKPDPSILAKRNYRYQWNNNGICSHTPEDLRIESFNMHVRKKAAAILCEDKIKSEKFSSSVRDGIDLRETMRNWFSQDIYVKEIPVSQGVSDMVVIIFDAEHDDAYTHRATWYAEHDQESTLTFFATDPFDDLIGPGISRCRYGGLSLLFPPRNVPDIFEMTEHSGLSACADILAYGALLFSQEKNIPYVSAKKPGVQITAFAAKFKKHFVWIPLSAFSMETIRRLRKFHVLNGKDVRSWASRFIGEI